jgi:hypothetical protein
LALAEMARAADILHLGSDSQPSFGGGIYRAMLNRDGPGTDRFLNIKRPVASPAKGVAGFELDQFAIGKSAANNLACFHADQSGCHV